jgi:hypothetical protein
VEAPDGVRTVNVPAGNGWPCSRHSRASSSRPVGAGFRALSCG